jgi:thiol-disulfide isomerase/thioredoxin
MIWRRRLPSTRRVGTSRLSDLGQAPELSGVRPWLNTPEGEPLTLARLSGRVVLIEFWTFACGNCQRTLPFVRRMHRRYRPELVVLGVHTPELSFERPVRNVERAVRERAIAFPVGLDNDYRAWDAYQNRYWPTQYLIDATGRIRYAHIGEGGYRTTEAAILALVGEARQTNVGDEAPEIRAPEPPRRSERS